MTTTSALDVALERVRVHADATRQRQVGRVRRGELSAQLDRSMLEARSLGATAHDIGAVVGCNPSWVQYRWKRAREADPPG